MKRGPGLVKRGVVWLSEVREREGFSEAGQGLVNRGRA